MKCPHCKNDIYELDYDVNSSCSAYIDKDDINKPDAFRMAYDIDSLLANVEFNNFSCSKCGELLAQTEEEAKELLK